VESPARNGILIAKANPDNLVVNTRNNATSLSFLRRRPPLTTTDITHPALRPVRIVTHIHGADTRDRVTNNPSLVGSVGAVIQANNDYKFEICLICYFVYSC